LDWRFSASTTVEVAMSYRIYVLNDHDAGGIEEPHDFADDEAAIRHAQRLARGAVAAEVWEGERLVVRRGAPFPMGPRGGGPAGG
jgi:hypothetical protein